MTFQEPRKLIQKGVRVSCLSACRVFLIKRELRSLINNMKLEVQGKIEKVPRGIQGEKSKKTQVRETGLNNWSISKSK